MKYKCGYCFVKLNDKEIKIQTIDRLMRRLHFKFKTLVCREDCRTISTNSMFETIQVLIRKFYTKGETIKEINKLSNDTKQNTNKTNHIDIHVK